MSLGDRGAYGLSMGRRSKRSALEILSDILGEVIGKKRVSRAQLIRSLGLNPNTLYSYLERLASSGVVGLVESERGVYVEPLPQAYRLYMLVSLVNKMMESPGAGDGYNRAVREVSESLRKAGFRVVFAPTLLHDLTIEGCGCSLRLALLTENDPVARLRVQNALVYGVEGSAAIDLSGSWRGILDGVNAFEDVDELVLVLRRECGCRS